MVLFSGCAEGNVEDKPTITLAVCSGAGLLHEDKIWEINCCPSNCMRGA